MPSLTSKSEWTKGTRFSQSILPARWQSTRRSNSIYQPEQPPPRESYHALTSDDYFAGPGLNERFDLIYLDGLHTYEQTLADLRHALERSHEHTLILIDDTVPNDVFSALPDEEKSYKYRARFGNNPSYGWHGDIYKLVIHIHDFMPELSYMTFISGGNPQTLVWREPRTAVQPLCCDPAQISGLDFFWLLENFEVLNAALESAVIARVVQAASAGRANA